MHDSGTQFFHTLFRHRWGSCGNPPETKYHFFIPPQSFLVDHQSVCQGNGASSKKPKSMDLITWSMKELKRFFSKMFFDGFCCRICCMSLSTRFCDDCFIFCRGEWHPFGQMERLITVFTNIAHCINQKSSFNNLHQITSNCLKCNRQRSHLSEYTMQGRIQDFKLGGRS